MAGEFIGAEEQFWLIGSCQVGFDESGWSNGSSRMAWLVSDCYRLQYRQDAGLYHSINGVAMQSTEVRMLFEFWGRHRVKQYMRQIWI